MKNKNKFLNIVKSLTEISIKHHHKELVKDIKNNKIKLIKTKNMKKKAYGKGKKWRVRGRNKTMMWERGKLNPSSNIK